MPMTARLRRHRRTKIVATLGPASADPAMIARLFQAGADVFRLNFSHGSHEDHGANIAAVRALEESTGRPIGLLADVQGPKLRIGRFGGGRVHLSPGQDFRLDMDPSPGGCGGGCSCRIRRSFPWLWRGRPCCWTMASCGCG